MIIRPMRPMALTVTVCLKRHGRFCRKVDFGGFGRSNTYSCNLPPSSRRVCRIALMVCHDRVEHRRIEWTIECDSCLVAGTPLHGARPMLHALDLDRDQSPCVEPASFQCQPAAFCRKIEDAGFDSPLLGPPQPDSCVQFDAWTASPRRPVALAGPPIGRYRRILEQWQPRCLREPVRRYPRPSFIMSQSWSPPDRWRGNDSMMLRSCYCGMPLRPSLRTVRARQVRSNNVDGWHYEPVALPVSTTR